jgi:hypothetical protein
VSSSNLTENYEVRKGVVAMRWIVALALGSLLALSAIGSVPASASPDVVRRGSCSDGARWRLELTDHGRQIEVDFEVHRSPAGDTWRVRLRDNGYVFFRGARTADDSGEFSVDPYVRDRSGTDRFVARATDSSTSEVCRGTAKI